MHLFDYSPSSCAAGHRLLRHGKHGGEADFEFESARLSWEIYDESEPTNWRPIVPIADSTREFKRTGRLVFEGIGQWDDTHYIRIWTDPSKRKYHWLRCLVEKAAYEYPPRIETMRPNTIPASSTRWCSSTSMSPRPLSLNPNCP